MRKLSIVVLLLLTLVGCNNRNEEHKANYLKIGTIAGPETEVMEVVAKVAREKYEMTVDFVVFTDYVLPNQALADGSIDANVYQHMPYLNAAIKNKGYKFVPIAKTFIYPMGLYSKKHKSLKEIQKGAIIGIPNDPSNEARALLLLEKAGLLKMNDPKDVTQTVDDIDDNPLDLKIKTIDAAQLPRSLEDVDLAAINTTYSIPAGLIPGRDALLVEEKDSPYANLIVVREADKNRIEFKKFVDAMHSQEVATKANTVFRGQAYPAW